MNIILQFKNINQETWETQDRIPLKGELILSEYPESFTLNLGDGIKKPPTTKPLSLYPSLSDFKKQQLKNLMAEYFNNRSKFLYDGGVRRESYAYPREASSLGGTLDGCLWGGKYVINCGVFAQLIWMGRSLSDYDTPTTKITTDFDWGYYFNFYAAQRAYGIKRPSDGAYYLANSYTDKNGVKHFVGFDGAATMANELYTMGCEIPYSEVQVGDLVFYRSPSLIDGSIDELEQSVFRYITHVGIVYDIDPVYGPIIMESTDAFTSAIGRCGMSDTLSQFGRIRGAGQEQRVCMAARHPAAWGKGGNVPTNFTPYRGIKA